MTGKKNKLNEIQRSFKTKKDFKDVVTNCDDITRMKKCPACGSRNYSVSAPLQNHRIVRNGHVVKRFTGRYDAGNFTCDDCGYDVSI